MKKSKKLKIITSSSVVATAAMITPMVATSCTTGSGLILNDVNAIDISTLNWFQETSFSTNNTTEIENIVISQNDGLFTEYKGLKE